MAGEVINWGLKISQSGAAKVAADIGGIGKATEAAAPSVAKLGDEIDKVAGDAAKLAAAAKASTDAVQGIAGSYRDAAGKLRAANGRFLSGGEIAAAAAPAVASIGDAAAGATEKVRSLSDEFDELQANAAKVKFNANKVLDEQSIARGLEQLKKLRAASRASAGATDSEKMMAGAMPDSLRPQKKTAGFSRFVQKVGNTFGPKAAGGVMKLGAAFGKLEPAVAALSSAGPALAAVGAGALAVGAGVAYGAAKFGSAVVQAQAYKEDVTRALTIMLKGKAAADNALKVAAKTADFIGEDRAKVAGGFVDLLAKGFDVKKADEITRRLADLGSVDPKARTEDLVRVIGQIASTGRLQGDELNELANAGLETGSVYDALGKQLGKTRAEVIKLKEAGKVTSDQAIEAILAAISDQAGGKAAGTAAAEKSLENISGLLKRISGIPSNVLFDAEVGASIDTVKSGMREVIALFDSSTATGEKVRRVVAEVFEALVSGFFGKAVTGGKTLDDRFNSILDTVSDMTPQIQEFARSIRDIGKAAGLVVGLVVQLQQIEAFFNGSSEELGAWGTVLKLAFAPFTFGYEVIKLIYSELASLSDLGIEGWLAGIGASIVEFGSDLLAMANDLGTFIIDGLTGGISGNAQKVIDSITGVSNDAINAAKRILGIASPSKVFEEIGAFTVAGFEQGVTANDNAGGAVESMLAPPSLADISQGAASAGSASSGAPISIQVSVDARGATGADAQRIGEQVAEQVRLTLESMALQLGAA